MHLSMALLVVARLARTSPKSEGKKFRPKFLHHHVKHQQPAIRTAWRIVFRPIRCAESTCTICLSMEPLDVEVEAKAGPISESEKFRQLFSPPSITTFNYNQNSVECWFWTSLMRRIRL